MVPFPLLALVREIVRDRISQGPKRKETYQKVLQEYAKHLIYEKLLTRVFRFNLCRQHVPAAEVSTIVACPKLVHRLVLHGLDQGEMTGKIVVECENM